MWMGEFSTRASLPAGAAEHAKANGGAIRPFRAFPAPPPRATGGAVRGARMERPAYSQAFTLESTENSGAHPAMPDVGFPRDGSRSSASMWPKTCLNPTVSTHALTHTPLRARLPHSSTPLCAADGPGFWLAALCTVASARS